MKRSLIIILSLFFAADLWAAAPGTWTVENTKVRKVNEEVEVSFDVNIEKLRPNYRVVMTPVLYNGADRLALEQIVVTGNRRSLYDTRNRATGGKGYVLKRKDTPAKVGYKALVPYQSWMNTVSLSLGETVVGCCSEDTKPARTLAADKLLYYEIVPAYNSEPLEYRLTELEKYSLENPFLLPVEDYPNRYDILFNERDKGTAVIRFTVGSHVIDMDIPGNKELLGAVGKAFQLIHEDPNASLKRIMIAGYASPEGTLAGNTALAQRRAESFRDYLLKNLDMPRDESLFELYNGREDWDGLRKMVAESDMEYRQEVLDIIDAYTIEQEERKTKLKQLADGKPYAYMLKNFYPALRNAGYLQVYYDIDRTASVATAVTDEHGRTTWIDPDSPENIGVTRINRAMRHMVEGDYEAALKELEGQQENPAAFNYIGVCYMMKGDYDTAEKFLRKAEAAGDPYASVNLEHIGQAKRIEF